MDLKAPRHGEESRALVRRLVAGLTHRGPDAAGVWSSADDYCTLGHRRLTIIDISDAANQPMLDASGRYAVSFNGEIYNYKEIRGALEARGIQFRTQSDTEVLLQAFIAYGTAAFEKMDGMFAVAIYDSTTRTLTLARDRAGEKPLYYVWTSSVFGFCSELRPLLATPGLTPTLSETSLALYMALRYVPAPHSFIEGIRKLEPGCILQIGPDLVERKTTYFKFDVDDRAAARPQKVEAFAEQVEAALAESLQGRLNSDVPLGCFLSSGVDSSLVCAILAKRMNRSVKSFTVGFVDDPGSENQDAAAIAQDLGIEHREYIFGPSDFDAVCDKIGDLLDEPNGDRSCVPTYLLSQFTHEHVKVAISGDGGDELFAGYSRYLTFLTRNAKTAWASTAEVAQRYFQTMLPVFAWPQIQEILPEGMKAVNEHTGSFGGLFANPERSGLHALRVLDFRSYLPGAVLAKVDRMSMRHGLEVRTPYLAPNLYALSARARVDNCYADGVQKLVLRRALARYLPARHVAAPKKGFGMPPSVFLANQDRVRQELQRSYGILEQSPFFRARPDAAARFVNASGANINTVWAAIVLSRWIESTGVAL